MDNQKILIEIIKTLLESHEKHIKFVQMIIDDIAAEKNATVQEAPAEKEADYGDLYKRDLNKYKDTIEQNTEENAVGVISNYDNIDKLVDADTEREDNLETFEQEDDYDDIMKRRIAYHKAQGTYQEQNKEETQNTPDTKNTDKTPDAPYITPLMTISKKEREELLKRLFKEAQENVKRFLQLQETDAIYEKEVFKEADRLLNNWMMMKKLKQI